MPTTRSKRRDLLFSILALLAALLACNRPTPASESSSWSASGGSGLAPIPSATHPAWLLPPTRLPGAPILTPTPDTSHILPSTRKEPQKYVVQPGDTLGQIATSYGVSVEHIVKANDLKNPNVLDVGQKLVIPAPTLEGSGPDFKIIPDSELVYGPLTSFFNVAEYINSQGGYLAQYHEKLDEDKKLSGAEIVELVARSYSINPRLFLAVLQYQSGWVTKSQPRETTLDYPIGWRDPQRKGLYRQLAWAANQLNRGYYLWRVDGVATWVFPDGYIVPIAPTINAGTAGVQYFLSQIYGYKEWKDSASPDGLFATYSNLFGYPFDLAIEPLLPPDLRQPSLQLPFEPGARWVLTGGPHGGWDDGSAWAALDFAPDTEAVGCVESDEWVVSVGNGLILRSEDGAVTQDLDSPEGALNDGLEQTGWVILYMHIESRGRVAAGTYLMAGERIGHPSCEGGVSTGTHLHLARRYNGEWIPADQILPFVLDGWISGGSGVEYEGYLERNGEKVVADAGQSSKNKIKR